MPQRTEKQKQALARLEVILAVRAGQMTATQAAAQLGISRNTYYRWEQRALQAMADALIQKDPGRPRREEDPVKKALEAELIQAKTEITLLQERLEINRIVRQSQEKALLTAKDQCTPRRSKKNAAKRKRKRPKR